MRFFLWGSPRRRRFHAPSVTPLRPGRSGAHERQRTTPGRPRTSGDQAATALRDLSAEGCTVGRRAHAQHELHRRLQRGTETHQLSLADRPDGSIAFERHLRARTIGALPVPIAKASGAVTRPLLWRKIERCLLAAGVTNPQHGSDHRRGIRAARHLTGGSGDEGQLVAPRLRSLLDGQLLCPNQDGGTQTRAGNVRAVT